MVGVSRQVLRPRLLGPASSPDGLFAHLLLHRQHLLFLGRVAVKRRNEGALIGGRQEGSLGGSKAVDVGDFNVDLEAIQPVSKFGSRKGYGLAHHFVEVTLLFEAHEGQLNACGAGGNTRLHLVLHDQEVHVLADGIVDAGGTFREVQCQVFVINVFCATASQSFAPSVEFLVFLESPLPTPCVFDSVWLPKEVLVVV